MTAPPASVQGRPLHPGQASGPVARLDAPLSFWGGFDPVAGCIIDQAHPQAGQSLAGEIVLMPGSRGSAGTPGVLAEAIRRQTGPAALLIQKADINLVAGAVVAASLYDIHLPIVLLDDAAFAQVAGWRALAVHPDGIVRPTG